MIFMVRVRTGSVYVRFTRAGKNHLFIQHRATLSRYIMKSKNTIFLIMGVCLVAGLLVTGCTQQAAPAQAPAVTPTRAAEIGMPNPASVNCGKVGATSVIMTNPDGSQYGMCTFPNGTTCEEWALFRGEGCKPNVAPTATQAK